MTDVLFRYALDLSGKVWKANEAPRDGAYTCLDHGCAMVLRRGEINAPHFAHLPDWAGSCSAESIEHKASKLKIIETVSSGLILKVERKGCFCGNDREPFALPIGCTCTEEVQFGRLRIDVVAYNDNKPALLIECRQTHEVDAEKARELDDSRIPWIEVHALDVLADPTMLHPIQGSWQFRRKECFPCQSKRILREVAEQEAREEDERKAEEERAQLAETNRRIEERNEAIRKQYAIDHAQEIAEMKARAVRSLAEAQEWEKKRAVQEAASRRWQCACGAAFDLPRICCAVCGKWAPEHVQQKRMRLRWPDASTHQVVVRDEQPIESDSERVIH